MENSFFANGLQLDASRALGEHHTLRAGVLADYTDEKLDTSSLVLSVDAKGMQTSDQPTNITDNISNHGLTAGVYLQDEWHLTDQLTLNYGARYDRFEASFEHEGQLSPRANLVWQINDKTSAHFGYARYFTPPSVQYIPATTIQKFRGTSNAPFNEQDDPTPCERSHYFDVGLSRQLTPPWQATVDAFYKDARNLIDLGQFGNAVILSPFSYREGTVYGSELSTTYKQGPFSAFANVSYVVTSARDINSAQFEFPQENWITSRPTISNWTTRDDIRFLLAHLMCGKRTPAFMWISSTGTACGKVLPIWASYPITTLSISGLSMCSTRSGEPFGK